MPRQALDPIDERIVPFMAAYGRAVLASAAVERVLLVDLVARRAGEVGVGEQLGEELRNLERRSAGSVAGRLAALGPDPELTARISGFVEQRNQLVHHFLEDPTYAAAMAGLEADAAINRLNEFAFDCEGLVNAIAPGAFGAIETMFGQDLAGLVARLREVDLDTVEDRRLRAQLRDALATFQHVADAEARETPG